MRAFDKSRLLRAAVAAMSKAYAPYSRFRVGAALLTADRRIVTGCNVENASYGLTICAERNAVFAAVAGGRREFMALAIVASGRRPPYPCGACRQVLAEFCGPGFPVLIIPARAPDRSLETTLGELLPMTFSL
jgi:cytidine deaminase